MFLNFFTLFMFFLISKEFIFYGEERLIVISYLSLFMILFFVLGTSLSSSFKHKSDLLKAEFDSFYNIILMMLNKTKTLVLSFSFFNLKITKLFIAIFNEFIYYFSTIASFNFLKFNFFKLKFLNMLEVSVNFNAALNSIFSEVVLMSFLNKLLAWKVANYVS